MSCGVDRRRSSDPELLRLWLWPVATALIRPLAWELPHAVGAALEKAKKTKKKKKRGWECFPQKVIVRIKWAKHKVTAQ